MYRSSLLVWGLVMGLAPSTQGALLSLEWAAHPSTAEHTMLVGETATINIRLDIIAGESWGWAEVPLGVGTWWYPDSTPQFEITGFAANEFIGPGFTYDRSGLPPLPFSPEDYRLITEWDQVTPIVGPASIYLDALAIVALAHGHDDIVFGESIPWYGDPQSILTGADGTEWNFVRGFQMPGAPGEWTDGVGDPGLFPATPKGAEQAPLPLVLTVVPEPGTVAVVGVGALMLWARRRRRD